MDLALSTGRGPAIVTDLEGRRPLVRDEDVVAFGRRDGEEAEVHGSQRIEDTAIKVVDLDEVRKCGASEAAHCAIEDLCRPEIAGFWVHLDADVLDDAVMPAVDYRMPGGLSLSELAKILQAAIASGRAIGLNITIFNPELDDDGSIAAAFVDALTKGLRS
jgi:arginase